MSGALVLLSGGMDSAVCLYRAVAEEGPASVRALFFDWNQRSRAQERRAAEALCTATGVAPPITVKLDFPYRGPLTSSDGPVPLDRAPSEIEACGVPATFFPGRNLVMVSYAFGTAAALDISRVYFGPNADDAAGYPDCREECLRMLACACRAGVDREIELVLPVISMSKPGIVREGDALGVPWEVTFSCYSPVEGRHCGRCDACVLREGALGSER